MFRKIIATVLLGILIFFFGEEVVIAESKIENLQNDQLQILIIYSNEKSEDSVNVRKLDMIFHHFTKFVHIVSDYDVTLTDVEDATHIVYYGETKKEIYKKCIEYLKDTNKPMILIGENIDQISPFSYMNEIERVVIHEVGRNSDVVKAMSLENSIVMKPIHYNEEMMKTSLYGFKDTERFPLAVQYGHYYVFNVDIASKETLYYYFADILHEILPNNHIHGHLAYLRLEDIHPMSDPLKLKAIGEYLNRRDIPYILVVIPVYIMPNTGERIYLSDAPELVSVLRDLQNSGGTIISHGYTHQYRDSETGEGFEFWDVENDQFIIEPTPSNSIEEILSEDQFPNRDAYLTYIADLKANEKQYIENRLQDSIHELVSYKLYPLAFEAPHYTMSQQGYGIVSNYFSTIFGQIQLSDDNWGQMTAPPFVSSANFLRGMTLYPETIGYVDQTVEGMKQNQKNLERSLIVRDSVIGGFYHPYLGLDELPSFLELFESVPRLEWLDLKKISNEVRSLRVIIASDGTGAIHVRNDIAFWESFFRRQELSLIEKILWGTTVIVFLFVMLFLFFATHLRMRLRKRLFQERKMNG